ncbi:MAG: polysaccharide export protein [Chitinophagaceae bacterium]|nr:polysaccharide export protein [Chitinophagaceae bacterium]
MKNYLCRTLTLLPVLCLLFSCKTSRQLTYFKDLSDTAALQTIPTAKVPPLKLQVDDQVQVSISSPSPEATSFFNLMASSPSAAAGGVTQASQSFINLYTISQKGDISLPVLGDVSTAGLTLEELRQKIAERLKPYLTNPIVSTRLTNFKVTVIGEVTRPFTVPVNGEKITVLEAIGASGDMTMFGSRKNVKVIRKLPDGNTEIARLDFNSSKIFQSPYYNLQQNDVVYIQPNKNKSFLANNTTFWASVALSIASITAVLITRL